MHPLFSHFDQLYTHFRRHKVGGQGIALQGWGWVATVGGLGRVPYLGSTLGSLVALPLGWVVLYFTGIWGLLTCITIATLLGTMAIAHVEKQLGQHDSAHIVVDELVGQWITILFLSPLTTPFAVWVFAFVIFRVFDITKPPPAKYVDHRMHTPFSVILDDIIAALYALAATCLFAWWWAA